MSSVDPHTLSRRNWLQQAGGGFGSLALAQLLCRDNWGDAAENSPGVDLNGGLHHPAKVRRVIQLFMNGGVSQMDTFDYKPALEKRDGEKVDFGITAAATSTPGNVMKSPFEFQQHGESGRWVSSALPHMAQHVDDLTFLMAMASKTNVHGPASYMQNTGFLVPGFPCMGSWITYALGNSCDNLPSFVVLPDARGLPYNGLGNFSQGFLPASLQGTVINPSSRIPIANLQPPETASQITPMSEAAGLELLNRLNERHLQDHPGDSRLAARMQSYELAARMQLSAPQVLDLTSETAETQEQYGLNEKSTADFGRNCLIARRMLEQGVRFVQLWSGMDGASNNWDNHGSIPDQLPKIANTVDRPISGLLTDLKQRGLLEDTLVVWTTEFGRMPFTQSKTGRDHNGGTFVTWLAGAGLRSGVAYGSSDEFGFKALEGTTYCYDLHATILHLLGIDHERLTFRQDGIDRRLTDVHGHVIHEILA
ncbi:MAG: DUF1501 domain-containing protein [Planctomycetaceae bacterium]|nr:DUF1501 domain-containing protein [Planctomycetaceae bacterium]